MTDKSKALNYLREIEDFCPKCSDVTRHWEVNDDEYFDFAYQCVKCNMVWEYKEPVPKEETDND